MKKIIYITLSLATIIMSSYMYTKETDTITLKYLYQAPRLAQDQPPLLILLHGVGSNEQDLFSLAAQLPAKYLIVSARGPITLGPESYAWYQVDFANGKPAINKEQAEKSRTTILEFIEQLKTKHQFDPQQVYLCGFSQGAIMSYSVGLTQPDKIKGIAIMSGRLLEEVGPLIKDSAQLSGLKIFVSHGTQDNVLGVHYATESVAYLKQKGLNPTFKTYPDGHTISAAMLKDLVGWLE